MARLTAKFLIRVSRLERWAAEKRKSRRPVPLVGEPSVLSALETYLATGEAPRWSGHIQCCKSYPTALATFTTPRLNLKYAQPESVMTTVPFVATWSGGAPHASIRDGVNLSN
jgi:hypothetical protein